MIYQALYGDFKTYARPIAMFLSEVDHENYPNVTQKYRFVQKLREELSYNIGHNTNKEAITEAELTLDNQSKGFSTHRSNNSENLNYEVKIEKTKAIDSSKKEELHPEANLDLMAFLDAKDCEEKLEILYSIRKSIDERTMGNIEIALDLPVGEGSLEHRVDIVKNNLQMMAKYENRRLR